MTLNLDSELIKIAFIVALLSNTTVNVDTVVCWSPRTLLKQVSITVTLNNAGSWCGDVSSRHYIGYGQPAVIIKINLGVLLNLVLHSTFPYHDRLFLQL